VRRHLRRTDEPTAAVVAATLNCNARCTMCDIWRNRVRDELRPEEHAALPASLRDVNLSGGEPFLRDDLAAIVAAIAQAAPACAS
jgi:molybdenum cofactor biosynthesis enzyme MoaA